MTAQNPIKSIDSGFTDRHLLAALEGAGLGVWIHEQASGHIRWSDFLCRLLGYSISNAPSTLASWMELIHPADQQAVQTAISSLRREGELEFQMRSNDGSWSRLRLRVCQSEAETSDAPQITMGTIANSVHHPSAPQPSHPLYRVLNSLPSHIAVIDHRGVIVTVNQHWRDFSYANEGSAAWLEQYADVGINYLDACQSLLGDKAIGAIKAGIQAVLAQELPIFSTEYPCHSPDEQRWFSMTVMPLDDGSGGAVIAHTTITEQKLAELALKAQLQLTEEIIDSAPGVFYLLDDKGSFLRWNKNLETISGYDSAAISHIGALGLFNPDTKPLVSKAIAETFSAGQGCVDAPLVTRDGKVIPCYFTGHTIKLSGKPCLIGFGIDMTDQKQSAAELEHHRKDLQVMVEERTRQLQDSETRMRTITDALPCMVSQWDKAGYCRFANRAYQEWFGQSPAQMQGKTIRHLLGEKLFLLNQPHIEAVIRGERQQFERTLKKPSGEIGHLLIDYLPEYVGENVIGFYVMVTDITLVKRAEAKLEKSQQLLRQLLVRQDQIRENERKHLARELHDELGQLLTGMHFMVSGLQLTSNVTTSQTNQMALELESYLNQTQIVVRRITRDLHPTQLENGLLPALEVLATEFSSRSGVACRLTLSGPEPLLNGTDATSVFRIAQESLTNVARHAQAKSVALHINSSGKRLNLKIKDDGQGFDPVTLRSRGLSFGLLGMQERAALLGATLQIDSSPGSGTRIELEMAIERKITT